MKDFEEILDNKDDMIKLFKALMPAGTGVSKVSNKDKWGVSIRGFHPFFDDKDYLLHIRPSGHIRISPNTYINPAKLVAFIETLGYHMHP